MRVELLTPTLSAAVIAEAREALASGPYAGVIDDLAIDLAAGRLPRATALIRSDRGAPLDALAAVMEPSSPGAPWSLAVVTDSDPDPLVVSGAFGALEAFLPTRAPVEWWARGAATEVVRIVADRHGFAPGRVISVMANDALSDFDEDRDTRPFEPGDSSAVVTINNAAFAGHGDRAAWTADTLTDELRRFGDAYEDLRISPIEGTPMGFCWTRPVDDHTGEIYVLATHPEAQGTGLGRALLAAGLAHIRDQLGARRAVLYVDADNARAVALYERHGFVDLNQSLSAFVRAPLFP